MTISQGPLVATEPAPQKRNIAIAAIRTLFLRVGVLPFFLLATLIIFALVSAQFLSLQNLTNVARQSVYLVLVSLGQMLVLITGGFDLSVGTAIAVTSVVSAMAMVALAAAMPDLVWVAILLGAFAGFAAALLIGGLNGLGVAQFGVSPFIMTLGLQSIGAGTALFLTGGVPVSGLPYEFGNFFGFGRVFGVPVPVLFAIVAIAAMWLIMNRTRFGAHVYAVGGNAKAANLSGVNTKKVLFFAYVICALLASFAVVLLTARVEFGRDQSRGHDRTGIDRRLRHCRRLAARRDRTRGERRARRLLHRAAAERHEHRSDRLVSADGPARLAARAGRHPRSGSLPHARRQKLTLVNPRTRKDAKCLLPRPIPRLPIKLSSADR